MVAEAAPTRDPPPTAAFAPPRRLRSLDVARGVAVAGMLVVNLQGSGEHPFPGTTHAPWHGFAAADLVFPAFLVVVGASMAFAFARYEDGGRPDGRLWSRILRRVVLLIALGLVVNGFGFDPLATLRLPGVLQRIGATYLLAVLVVLYVPRRAQWALGAGVLVGYWAALALVPVPGHDGGALTPEGNLAGWVHRAVFGPAHLYGQGPYDPEGLLSTLPATVSVLIGYWAGRWLRRATPGPEVAGRLAAAGAAGMAVGLAWHPWFPLNKHLWTSSFVLFTGGACLLLLAACYVLVELVSGRPSRVFEPLGRNAILVYVLSGLAASVLGRTTVAEGGVEVSTWQWLYEQWFASWAGPTVGSLAQALAFVALSWAVAVVLHRHRWYLRV